MDLHPSTIGSSVTAGVQSAAEEEEEEEEEEALSRWGECKATGPRRCDVEGDVVAAFWEEVEEEEEEVEMAGVVVATGVDEGVEAGWMLRRSY